jgi:hypothetical protein
MSKELEFESKDKLALYSQLRKLNIAQFKIFYGAFVHYLARYRYFISKQNFVNLRCELNLLCHELDESFPDQYDDYEIMKSFFLVHPYYYMDKLPIELMAKLFSELVDNRIDVLTGIAKAAAETDIHGVYAYANHILGLNEQIDILAAQAKQHIKDFS